MNSKSKIVTLVLIVVAIIIIVLIAVSGNKGPASDNDSLATDNSGPVAVVSETKKVSSTLSEYHNAELGFALKYPSEWEKEDGNAGVTFILPIDSKQVSTVATLQVSVQVISGSCAFPPVTTIKDRSTVKFGTNSFNMISMSNTVQGRVYFNRMYSLQSGDVCYMFSLASISLNPTTKGLTGSNITQAQNNNKAITNSADLAFTEMVKTFGFVAGPQGIDETKAPPVK
jgi:hypothetical protein